ncbi:unnamed protein product [Lactuca saligna]|uniref:Uncharacterized protein n=1 Tax=Lactuca saligna TaxID=75948 RepID=A0AA36DYR6_LACSI|nr:unnamed protein product [Lactuca saligna]
MESKVMDGLAVKTEKVEVLGLVSDIIDTKDSMITITVRKHLAEKFRPVFVMLHRLEGVSPQNSDLKQGGEGGSGVSRNEPPKDLAKPIVQKYPKGKEKLIGQETIIDNDEDEEPDEAKLKRLKACDAKLNENQRIVNEAEEKERDEKRSSSYTQKQNALISQVDPEANPT